MNKDIILRALPDWSEKMQKISKIKNFCENVPEESMGGYCCMALFTSNIDNVLKKHIGIDEVYVIDTLSPKETLKKLEKIESNLFKDIEKVLEIGKND